MKGATSLERVHGVILKSRDGIPNPLFPKGVVIADEARKARVRFYPVTILYTAFCIGMLVVTAPRHPLSTLLYFSLGVAVWTGVEYAVHRYVLHGRFPDGPGFFKHQAHRFFDTMHGDHHQRPWDGMHINGYVDSVPFAILFIGVSLLAPLHTAPVFVAALLQSYVVEEWVHYSVHFHAFRSRYFQYIRFHHWYHHSPRGAALAFGLSSGIWDTIVGTQIPEGVRRRPRPAVTPLSSEPFPLDGREPEATEQRPPAA
jgi:hypothetical protein